MFNRRNEVHCCHRERESERDELVRKDEANVRHPSDDVSIVYMPKV